MASHWKFAKLSRISKPRDAYNRPVLSMRQWDFYNQKRPGRALFDPKELWKVARKPRLRWQALASKTTFGINCPASGYVHGSDRVLKKLIVSTVGEAMSIRGAKPRQVCPHEEGSQWLSLVLPLSKTYHCWDDLPGLRQALEVLRCCLIHRAWQAVTWPQCQGMFEWCRSSEAELCSEEHVQVEARTWESERGWEQVGCCNEGNSLKSGK